MEFEIRTNFVGYFGSHCSCHIHNGGRVLFKFRMTDSIDPSGLEDDNPVRVEIVHLLNAINEALKASNQTGQPLLNILREATRRVKLLKDFVGWKPAKSGSSPMFQGNGLS